MKRFTCSGKVDHPVFFPADMIKLMYDHGPKVFNKCMFGKQGARGLEEFWKASEYVLRDHPHLDRSALHCSIPIMIHGDMARIYKVSSTRASIRARRMPTIMQHFENQLGLQTIDKLLG